MSDVDLTLDARRSIVGHLAGAVGADVYGEFTPSDVAWPFVRYGGTTVPYEDSCSDGVTLLVSLHVFANGPATDGVLTLARQIVERMESWSGGDATWTGNVGPLADNPEASKWHVVVQYSVVMTR